MKDFANLSPGFYVIRLKHRIIFEASYFSGLFWYVCGSTEAYESLQVAEVEKAIEIKERVKPYTKYQNQTR